MMKNILKMGLIFLSLFLTVMPNPYCVGNSEAASLTMLTPSGGETWVNGESVTLRWSSSDAGSYVKLGVFLHQGGGWALRGWITESTSNDGSYQWTVTSPIDPLPRSDFSIGIFATANENILDFSNDFTIIEACTYSIYPTSTNFTSLPTGNSGSVAVTTNNASCSWSAYTNYSWIHITSGSSGTGSGTVYYSLDPFTGTFARTGTIIIENKTFSINQWEQDSDDDDDDDIITLYNNQTESGLSGSAGSSRYYQIDVPSGQDSFEVKTWDGSGDCDLYVRRGSLPATNAYDDVGCIYGNDETVTFSNPQSGTWYIMVYGYGSYSGASLNARYWAVNDNTDPEDDDDDSGDTDTSETTTTSSGSGGGGGCFISLIQ